MCAPFCNVRFPPYTFTFPSTWPLIITLPANATMSPLTSPCTTVVPPNVVKLPQILSLLLTTTVLPNDGFGCSSVHSVTFLVVLILAAFAGVFPPTRSPAPTPTTSAMISQMPDNTRSNTFLYTLFSIRNSLSWTGENINAHDLRCLSLLWMAH